MNINFILYLGRHPLETALLVAAPALLTCLIAGVAITLFQAVTSMRDMTLTIVPRFFTEIFGHIQSIGH